MKISYQQMQHLHFQIGYIADSSIYLPFLENLFSHLPAYYQQHVQKYKQPLDRLNSILCYYLLQLLSKRKVKIAFSENGKPFTKQFFFSFAHCEKQVICCVSKKKIGIDIEKKIPYSQSLENKICTEKEKINTSNQSAYLTKIWTEKESYIKMNDLIHSFDFSKIATTNAQFYSFWLEKDTFCSICYEK